MNDIHDIDNNKLIDILIIKLAMGELGTIPIGNFNNMNDKDLLSLIKDMIYVNQVLED